MRLVTITKALLNEEKVCNSGFLLTTILKKLGFSKIGSVMHPDDGEVWEWRRA